jgi:hypothetical protein
MIQLQNAEKVNRNRIKSHLTVHDTIRLEDGSNKDKGRAEDAVILSYAEFHVIGTAQSSLPRVSRFFVPTAICFRISWNSLFSRIAHLSKLRIGFRCKSLLAGGGISKFVSIICLLSAFSAEPLKKSSAHMFEGISGISL